MMINLGLPETARGPIVRLMKDAYDRRAGHTSGWCVVHVAHPQYGRRVTGPLADRLPGCLHIVSDQPGDEPDAIVVPAGYADPLTGDVLLASGCVVPPDSELRAAGALPAVALFGDGGTLRALIGVAVVRSAGDGNSAHELRAGRLAAETVAAIEDWLRATAGQLQ